MPLVLGPDAYRDKDLLRSRKDLGPVVLDWRLEELEIDPDTEKETRHLTGKILFDAGIEFAITSRPMSRGSFNPDRSTILSVPGAYHLWYQAATLVRQGLTREEAIRAITLRPAEVLGLAHRVGRGVIPKAEDEVAAMTSLEKDCLRSHTNVDRSTEKTLEHARTVLGVSDAQFEEMRTEADEVLEKLR